MRVLLEQALREGWARPALLLPPAADLVKLRLREGKPIESDALLHLMLVTAPNCDIELEAMLTAMRRQLLAQPQNRDLVFTAALAQQCFINEYVFAEEPEERGKAEALARGIEKTLAEDDVVPAIALLAVACYIPIHTLQGAHKLLDKALPDPLEPVLRQQLAEPMAESRLAESLPALTAVADDAVRTQYEENPYPRWVRMDASELPVPLAQYLGKHFSVFDAARLPLLPDMLFAGCGTGRFALELSRHHPAQSRLAIDLSRPALAYAARKAAEAGVVLDFAQADILRLPDTKKRFSMIECSGVLHHMADPFAGWRALAACLLPGGVMRLSLYSTLGRTPVREARDWAGREDFAATPGGIRAARQRLIAERPTAAAQLLGTADFYSVSAWRDLLFHVREHDLTLTAIDAFLKEQGLIFLGFETGEDVLGAYRARFPDDPAAADLANWAAFEAEHPAVFAAMYQFWVQKP
jgi:SAM-dependent methyltransferase